MPRLLLSLLTLLLVGAAISCGGDDNDDPRASADDLPDGIPVFEGSQFTGGREDGADGFTGSWNVPGGDPQAIREFFERELADGEFRIVDTVENPDGSIRLVLEDPDDPARGGTIVIEEEEDGDARIVKTIGRDQQEDDDGDEDDEVDNSPDEGGPDEGELDEDGKLIYGERLPPNWPADDVPFPSQSEPGSSSYQEVAGEDHFIVDFTSDLSPAELIAELNATLNAQGWVTGSDNDAEEGFTYTWDRDGDSVLLSGAGDDSGSDASIFIQDRP